ncbi:Caleosin related protein-domain-containing protein [Rhexocercosporidium sp. MPI-PUGE-AT-0058]|nr:Caleosin related protein-domain-containing protein [Rhexocercosporidium sp. MPI-PUGE-AT-0058]
MAPPRAEEDGFDVSIEKVPVTVQRRPFIQKGDEKLKDPGTPRANIAASVEVPDGTQKGDWARRYKGQTVLQQHISFFDPDSDGIIHPWDTYNGFHRLGYGIILSLLSVLIIPANFSYPTLPPGHFLPDPLFRIYIARIHKDKHGSDSGTYDTEGRFVPQKFEDIFEKYAGGDKLGITMGEVWVYFKGQRLYGDPVGWGAALFEWIATWILLWPDDGRMKKEDIRRIYDGSLFFEIAARREKRGSQRMINGS